MKKIKIIIALAVLTLCVSTQRANAWFGSDGTKERELQRQIQQEREKASNWQTATSLLGIGCVVVLVIGAAIGSKGKRAAKEAVIHESETQA